MIYIFYPSNILGGAEYLLIRTVGLLQCNGSAAGVVDFEDGWIINNITNNKIKKIHIQKNKKVILNDDDIIITTANYMYKLDHYFYKSNTRVLLWAVHPYNNVVAFPKLFKKIPFLRKIRYNLIDYYKIKHKKNLESIKSKSGIVAMDGECDKVLFQRYGLRYEKYLPVYINDDSFSYNNISPIINSVIKGIWLGRIDLDFKIHILKKLLLDIEGIGIAYRERFIMDIVGDGPGLKILKSFVEEKISFKVNFLGEMKGNELESIINEATIGFAMGTSALDIAAKRIPTILLDFSYHEVLTYKYRWLFQTNKYILGRDIQSISKRDMDEMNSLECIFRELTENTSSLSTQCFNYVYENHSSYNSISKLKEYTSLSKFTINDVYSYRINKPFWERSSRLIFYIRTQIRKH